MLYCSPDYSCEVLIPTCRKLESEWDDVEVRFTIMEPSNRNTASVSLVGAVSQLGIKVYIPQGLPAGQYSYEVVFNGEIVAAGLLQCGLEAVDREGAVHESTNNSTYTYDPDRTE